jgi:hypothetical protein
VHPTVPRGVLTRADLTVGLKAFYHQHSLGLVFSEGPEWLLLIRVVLADSGCDAASMSAYSEDLRVLAAIDRGQGARTVGADREYLRCLLDDRLAVAETQARDRGVAPRPSPG